MNPKAINTTNVKNFGFSTVLDIKDQKMIFDITGLTTFNVGGAANIVGISFEVIDPSGVTVHTVGFTPPDIDPSVINTFELQLTSGISRFGNYRVKGVLKEADNSEYTIELPVKEVCEPAGFKKGVVTGTFKEVVSCNSPYIRITETTPLTYLGKKYYSVTKDGSLYYPQGTLSVLSFTKTPVQTAEVYTGDYVVRNRTIADYDLGDLFYVRITYDTTYKFSVTCASSVCDIACCIQEVYEQSIEEAGNSKGVNAKKKLEQIYIPLLTAISKERCGKETGAEIKVIRDILDCDCDCTSKLVEPVPVSDGSGNVTVYEGDCATEVELDQAGNTTTVTYKSKHVILRKADEDDEAFSISKSEDACSVYWDIAFNYTKLAEAVFNITSTDINLKNLLNSLIVNNGGNASIAGLDGKCVGNFNSCNYTLEEVFTVGGSTVSSIIIDGVTYNAPGATSVSNAAAVSTWLNGLGKGTWVTSWDADIVGGALQISSLNNEHTIGTIIFTISATPVGRNFIAVCKALKDVLQIIIDYLCTIDAAKIAIGTILKVCRDIDGVVVPKVYDVDTDLASFLIDLSNQQCELMNKVKDSLEVTCSSIRALFPPNANAYVAEDKILGTKGGTCGEGTLKDLVLGIINVIKTDSEVKAAYCTIDCLSKVCPAASNLAAVPA